MSKYQSINLPVSSIFQAELALSTKARRTGSSGYCIVPQRQTYESWWHTATQCHFEDLLDMRQDITLKNMSVISHVFDFVKMSVLKMHFKQNQSWVWRQERWKYVLIPRALSARTWMVRRWKCRNPRTRFQAKHGHREPTKTLRNLCPYESWLILGSLFVVIY